MKPHIVTITTNAGEQYDFRLERPSLIVGRSGSCDLQLPSASISSFHARLQVDPSTRRVSVTDLGSKNGTIVRGQRISPNSTVTIDFSDKVAVGEVTLRIRPLPKEWDEASSLSLEDSQSLSRSLLRGMLGDAAQRKRASLDVIRGATKGLKYTMDEGLNRVLIGTGPTMQLDVREACLDDDPVVVVLDGVRYCVLPHTTVPIRVGREEVKTARMLRSSDQIRVSKTTIRFDDPLEHVIVQTEARNANVTLDHLGGVDGKSIDENDRPTSRDISPPLESAAQQWTLSERLILILAVVALVSVAVLLVFVFVL